MSALLVGVDPGVNTGIAIKQPKTNQFKCIHTLTITKAMALILKLIAEGEQIDLYVEDARQRKWFTGGAEKQQGAGSIKRDCSIWESFAGEQEAIRLFLIPPRYNLTKVPAQDFIRMTGFTGRTSSHARDAAMLIFGR